MRRAADNGGALASVTEQPGVSEPARRALLTWIDERRSRWPYTPNRHVLINYRTTLGDGPVSGHYLQGQLLPSISLDHICGDRILSKALAVEPDPQHLALVFNLSHTTASRYNAIAQRIPDEELRGRSRSRPPGECEEARLAS